MRIKQLLLQSPGKTPIMAQGWVKTARDTKTAFFVEITDGSCLKGLQAVIDKASLPDPNLLHRITTGTSLCVKGILVASPAQEQSVELAADSVEIIGDCPAETYPLQKKRHSFDFLREQAHLRGRTNSFSAVWRIRNRLAFSIHEYFQGNGFLYVQTPIITSSDCEGAGQMFQVTTLESHNAQTDYGLDFFGKKASLSVSGQLEGETFAMAMKDIYTFGPTFRAENSNTSRHLAEFWMVEPEMAFCALEGNMDTAESFLKHILKSVLTDCAEDMAFLDKWVREGLIQTIESVVSGSFVRLTYSEAVEQLIQSGVAFEYPVQWGIDIQSEHEKYLTEVIHKAPVILTDYPKEIKAFYMKQNDDGKTVRAMDVLVPRLGEIIGGSERESSLEKLTKRMEQSGLKPEDYWWYLDLRRFGSAPHSGFGLGFERLVQYATGMANIRDVIPFPRAPGLLDF